MNAPVISASRTEIKRFMRRRRPAGNVGWCPQHPKHRHVMTTTMRIRHRDGRVRTDKLCSWCFWGGAR